MNARKAPSKRSRIERQMDTLILGMFALLFAMCVIGATCFTVWTRSAGTKMWYLRPESTAAAVRHRLQHSAAQRSAWLPLTLAAGGSQQAAGLQSQSLAGWAGTAVAADVLCLPGACCSPRHSPTRAGSTG